MDIDFVLAWVDGSDNEWQKEKAQYCGKNTSEDGREERYRDWDILKFWFRGVEKYASWVNKIFFVTWGHLPDWLNTDCKNLVIVKHKDYIPAEYLPTFNSNVIEMNYFRIKELSENFILFNDDLFITQPIAETYYFQNNLPCEEAVETHFILKADNGMDLQMNYACVNNMVILNRNFNKQKVICENPEKWFNPVYEKRMQQNVNLSFWNNFESFVYPHEAMPMKKSVLKEIWEKEPEALRTSSCNKFRSFSDVTQRLITMWQICSGEFVPHKYQGKLYLIDKSNFMEAAEAIVNQTYPIISLNESSTQDFALIKETINRALDKLFSDKSKYEL